MTQDEATKVVESYKLGEKVPVLASTHKVSKKTIYRILEAAGVGRRDKQSAEKEARFSKIDSCRCSYCAESFDRQEGERNKLFCSPECYHGYMKDPYPAHGKKDSYPLECKEAQNLMRRHAHFYEKENNADDKTHTEEEELPDFLIG